MKEEEFESHFTNFKPPKGEEYFFKLIAETRQTKYFLHTSGKVFTLSNTGKERLLKPSNKYNKYLSISINNKAYRLDKLVMSVMDEDFDPKTMTVKHLDKDFRNCDCNNLYAVPKNEIASLNASEGGKYKKIIIDGVTYNTINDAARDLYINRNTLSRYISNKSKKTYITTIKKIVVVFKNDTRKIIKL